MQPQPFPFEPEIWARVEHRLNLPPRFETTVRHLLCGMSNQQIAQEMGIKVCSIQNYFQHIFARIGVADRVELIIRVFTIAHEEGW